MHTGQTLLTILAFIVLTTVLTNFYRSMDNVGDTVDQGQDGILATSINTSYAEMAERLAFDSATIGNNIMDRNGNRGLLTDPNLLGAHPEFGEDKDSIFTFVCIDAFNRDTLDRSPANSGRVYRTAFNVCYVDSSDFSVTSPTRTYVKRLDMMTWRILPPPAGDRIDTVKMSLIVGHFTF